MPSFPRGEDAPAGREEARSRGSAAPRPPGRSPPPPGPGLPAPHRRRDGPLLLALQLRVSTSSPGTPPRARSPPVHTSLPLSLSPPRQVNALVRPLPASPGKRPLGRPALFAPRGWGVPCSRRGAPRAREGGRDGGRRNALKPRRQKSPGCKKPRRRGEPPPPRAAKLGAEDSGCEAGSTQGFEELHRVIFKQL